MTPSAISEVMSGPEAVASLDDSGAMRVKHDMVLGVFPSPQEMAVVDDGELRRLCRVGYRSQRLIRLSHRFAHEGLEGEIHRLLEPSSPTSALYSFLLSLEGFGPFAAANATALLGRYDVHPFDSESVRHMREWHGVDRHFKLTSQEMLKAARVHYSEAKYGKFIFLVYWYELWCGYEKRAACRAEQWTQAQFSSFSNGGHSLQAPALNAPKPHSLLVAAQTRRRKQAGGSSHSTPRKRRSIKPKVEAAEEDGEEEKENVMNGAVDEADREETVKARDGRITGLLKAVKKTGKRAQQGGKVLGEKEAAVAVQGLGLAEGPPQGRMTRTRARLSQSPVE